LKSFLIFGLCILVKCANITTRESDMLGTAASEAAFV